jgi:hypothetical protein
MSTSSAVLFCVRRPISFVPQALQAPLLGLAWVFSNVGLVTLGINTSHHITYPLLAGGADGAILAVIVIATISEKFQAGITGLLSGYGYGNIATDFAPAQRLVTSLHAALDKSLDLLTPGPHNEALHDAIQAAVTWIIGTVLVVILAALIVQWIRIETTRKQPRPQLDASPAPQP